MAVRTAGQLRPVNSTICITPYCFLCNRITCLRRSCSSARLCLRASSSLIGKVMNCVATTINISLGRVYKDVASSGSAEASYYSWVDQHNTFGLGANAPFATGNASDSLHAFVDGKFIELRVPYPMGFYAKGLDGRIDDATAGWKGRPLVDLRHKD